MLELILGRAGTGKTEYLREALAKTAGRAILIVPEQFTFESESALLARYGVETANRVQVTSFTRLAEAAFRRYGGGAGRRLTDGGRRILMTLAIESCVDRLTLFEKSAANGKLTETMLTAVGEMKICGVSPDALRSAAPRAPGRSLTQKLREIALIFDAYEALVAQTYLDPLDDLTRLDAVLERHPDFFDGAFVAVDAFDGFTAQEYKILAHALRRAERVAVALCTDDLDTEKRDLFSPVRRTAEILRRIARENGVPIAAPKRFSTMHRFQNDALRAMEAALAGTGGETAENRGAVRVLEAGNVFEEAEQTAAAVRRLVMEEGYRYREIAVVCRSAETYSRALSAAFRRWDIPAFFSEERAVDAEPVMHFVLSAFDAVTGGWRSDPLLSMLKTGLTDFTAEETAELENYIFTWRLNGRAAWLSPFEKHPEGYGKPMDGAAQERLAALNALRERLVSPLERFSAAIRGVSGEEIAAMVYRLLTDFRVDETLPVFCRKLELAGRPDLSAAQERLWDLLMSVLDQMAGVLGTRETDPAVFGRLMREIVRGESVYDIPQNADTVTFGAADRIRPSAPRAVFLLGCGQGLFPLTPSPGGVFSDAERRALIRLDLPLSDALEDRMLHERFIAYSAACFASEKLFLSFSTEDGGTPGELVRAALSALPGLQTEKPGGARTLANAPEAAFSVMASLFRENTRESSTLRAVFAEKPAFSGRMASLGGEDRMAGARVSPDAAARLFGGGHVFSASQIETYHACRFRYFCRYALGAKERRPAELDALEYGTLMHFLFERVIGDKDEDVKMLTPERLSEKVRACIETYARENMGGTEGLSDREKYRFRRMEKTAGTLILHVAEELKSSRFVPRYFELPLEYGGAFPPLRIPTKDGFVRVGGVVDRVDVFESPRGPYVRVVDYKTGYKDFRLSDVLYGMSLQMLLYLAALTEHTGAHPAGVLYMPSFLTPIPSDKTEPPEKLKKAADKALCMNGVILNDTEIALAMESDLAGRFVPVKLAKDGSLQKTGSLLAEDALGLVMDYVKRLVATMAETLRAGDVSAKPLQIGTNACAFCPYTAVCGSERAAEEPEKNRMKSDEILANMEERLRKGDGDGAGMDKGTA